MFKRVKSLVLAGALVLGMAIPAFAADESIPDETTLEKVTRIYLEKMKAVGTIDENTKIRTITEDDYVSDADWQKFMDGINKEEKNNRLVIEYDENLKVYKVYFDVAPYNKVDASDILIDTIDIAINNDDVAGKGILDVISPETGDMIAYGGLAVAAIAGAGLYISNKKRK